MEDPVGPASFRRRARWRESSRRTASPAGQAGRGVCSSARLAPRKKATESPLRGTICRGTTLPPRVYDMANAQLGSVLHHLRRLVAARQTEALSDQQLLHVFASDNDQNAFTALVERHGRLVLSVCRHVLQHVQDAEDAFQATFLVLARKAGSIRKREALASWL